jgi:DNA-3-methyladenine glycosylase
VRGSTESTSEARVAQLTATHLDPLHREFYLRPTIEVARDLLGRYLVIERADGPPHIARLVETEAYLGEEDLACHASHGQTRRTAPMYEEAGHAYIYFIYGMYWCLNVVTEAIGRPYAVLLRAAEPITDLPAMNGPGKLCRALDLDGAWNRADLTSSRLCVTQGDPLAAGEIGCTPRVGVAYAGPWAEKPLRFFDRQSRFVSGPRPRPRR